MYAWGDNDHGQQGNSSTIVNRKPALVHGLEDIFINRVACGSSHSIAWNLQQIQAISKQEPVIFSIARDPLGSHALGLYDGEKSATNSKIYNNSLSLSTIVMSLESSTAKQQALHHILNAMHIQLLRQALVKALSSHTNITNADCGNLKVFCSTEGDVVDFMCFIFSSTLQIVLKSLLKYHHHKRKLLLGVGKHQCHYKKFPRLTYVFFFDI